MKTEATRGVGVEELVERLDEHREHILAAGQLEERRRRNLHNEVLAIATARMRRRLEEELSEDAEFKRLLERGRPAPAGPGERGDDAAGARGDLSWAQRSVRSERAVGERATERWSGSVPITRSPTVEVTPNQ